MPDKDLILRVEDGWKNAKRGDLIEEWWEVVRGAPPSVADGKSPVCNFVCDLQDTFEADLVGLFREDRKYPGRPTLVTVLTHDMVAQNKAINKWARTPDKIGEPSLLGNALGAQLAKLPALPKPEVAPQDLPIDDPRSPYHNKPGFRPGDPGGYGRPPAPVSPPKQAAVPAKPVPPPVQVEKTPMAEEMILVSWQAVDSTARGYMPVPKSEVSSFVDQLVETGVAQSSVEFWAKREAKVRRTVVVEF